MTGTLAQEQETFALDPPTLSADLEERQAEAILCCAELEAEARAKARFSAIRREESPSLHGYSFATLARMHLQQQRMATRTALLTMPISTKADAVGGIDLLAGLDDAEVADHVLASLRAYLSVD